MLLFSRSHAFLNLKGKIFCNITCYLFQLHEMIRSMKASCNEQIDQITADKDARLVKEHKGLMQTITGNTPSVTVCYSESSFAFTSHFLFSYRTLKLTEHFECCKNSIRQ